MSKSSTTVRDVFELPEAGSDGSENWRSFQEKVKKEVKGIKGAALADMAGKVAELFEIPLPDIFLTSWKKAGGIQSLLEESRSAPETVMNAELGDHTINSQHKPHIEIRIQNKAVKKIEFTLKLVFKLKGFVLKIQNGAIRSIQTGSCEAQGKMEFQGLVIAEKKLSPIILPGTIAIDSASTTASVLSIKEDSKVVGQESGAATSNQKAPQPDTKNEESVAKEGITEKVLTGTSQPEPTTTSPRELLETPEALGYLARLRELAAPEIVQRQSAVEVSKTEKAEVVPMPEEQGRNPQQRVAAPEEQVRDSDESVESANTEAVAGVEPPVATEEVEERTTWEVGEEEELPAPPQGIEPSQFENHGEQPVTDESPEDVISRMSRELADKQQSTRGDEEANDRANAAS